MYACLCGYHEETKPDAPAPMCRDCDTVMAFWKTREVVDTAAHREALIRAAGMVS